MDSPWITNLSIPWEWCELIYFYIREPCRLESLPSSFLKISRELILKIILPLLSNVTSLSRFRNEIKLTNPNFKYMQNEHPFSYQFIFYQEINVFLQLLYLESGFLSEAHLKVASLARHGLSVHVRSQSGPSI